MYQYSNSKVRKMPEEKEPDNYDHPHKWRYCLCEKCEAMRVYYNKYIVKPEEFPISGNHNWKEGQLIEEGKDFKLEEIKTFFHVKIHDGDFKYYGEESVMYAIPTQAEPSTGSEEEELSAICDWLRKQDRTMRITDEESLFYHVAPLTYAKLILKYIQESRKPSSSSLHS